jgi:hypothetical protein
VIGREESLRTIIDEGLDEFKGRCLEILPAEGVVWCEAPKSTTQSWTEVGGWSAMTLKEFVNDCWSQLAPFQDIQPGEGTCVACWYSGYYYSSMNPRGM